MRKRFRMIVALLVLTSATALAQTYEIRGIVMEVGTTQPVTDAQVHISKDTPIQVGQFQMAHTDPVAELTTDGQGRFMLTVEETGDYIITVDKEGFVGMSLRSGGTRQANIVLNEKNPEADVGLSLGRAGQVTGRFVDAETGDPISGLHVRARLISYNRGVRFAGRGIGQMTEEDGRFTITGLIPTDYVISTEDFTTEAPYLLDFTEANFDVVDQGYPNLFFPGGASLDRALPFAVPSGGVLELGTFSIRPAYRYQARITIADDNCQPGTPVFVSLYIVDALGAVPPGPTVKSACGGAFLFQNLEAGSYRMYARTRTDDETPYRLMADMELSIDAENRDVKMFLQPGATLEGRIVPAEGAGELDLQTLSPQLNIIHSMMTAIDLHSPGVAENGRFSQDDTRPATYEVVVNRLPPGAYISEVRYKGVGQPGLQFDFTGDGLLEIEVDTRSATLSGTVGDRDGPISNATVAVVPWPVPRPDERRLRVPLLETDEAGSFTTSLPPGDYRVFALSEEDAYSVDRPGVIERLAARGEKLEAGHNGVHTLTLEPEDPSR